MASKAGEPRRSLGECFDEVHKICRVDDYTLDTGERRDRADWITDGE